MKKALVVLLALALVGGAFADAPVANVDVAEFSGSATVTWGVDLDNDNKTGFKNDASATFKVNIADGGSAATEGDGVWGEIEIKVGDALVVKQGALDGGKAEVKKALLHLGPVYMGILADGTKIGDYAAPEAIKQFHTTDKVGEDKTQGVVFGYDSDLFNVAVDFRSVAKYNDDYAIRAKLGLKPIDGLEANVGFSYAFESKVKGLGANVSYALPVGEFTLKPGLGYSTSLGDNEKGLLAIGLLFGFNAGDTGDDPVGLPYFDKDDLNKKGVSGVSVSTKLNLSQEDMIIPLTVGLYTGDIVENLTAAFVLDSADVSKIGDNFVVAAALKYAAAVGDGTITPRAGVLVKQDTGLQATVGAEFAGFVDNTTFDAVWKSGNLKAEPDAKMGTFNVSVKIAL